MDVRFLADEPNEREKKQHEMKSFCKTNVIKCDMCKIAKLVERKKRMKEKKWLFEIEFNHLNGSHNLTKE